MEFSGNSVADRLDVVAQSTTTIEYYPASLIIIENYTREDNESTIYFQNTINECVTEIYWMFSSSLLQVIYLQLKNITVSVSF